MITLPRSQLVYVAGVIGGKPRVKIGTTSRPLSVRLAAMQTGSPYQLVMLVSFPGGRDDEQRLHEIFRIKRVHGEWFNRTGRLAAWITRIRKIQEHNGPVSRSDAMDSAERPDAPKDGVSPLICDARVCGRRIRTAFPGQDDGVFCSVACAAGRQRPPQRIRPSGPSSLAARRAKRRVERDARWAAGWTATDPLT